MEERETLKSAPKNEKENKESLKDATIEDYDYLANSATGMDCTGLMYRAPINEDEMESYQEVYQYLPPNVKINATEKRDSVK